jgi:hypothetical protein
MTMEFPPDFRVDIFIYPQDGQWIAHCIQLDIAVSDADRPQAVDECVATCAEHLAFAIDNGRMDTAFKMAPAEILRQFLRGRKVGTITVPLPTTEDHVRRVDFQEVSAAA